MLNHPERAITPSVKTAPAATLRTLADFILILRCEFDLAASCQLQSPLLSRAANYLDFQLQRKNPPCHCWKQGKRISLQEQPFRLLVILLENAGEVVTRAQIQGRIWDENTFVDFDSGLRVAVGKLRTALGDDAG